MQLIQQSESTAAQRRVFFTAVNETDVQDRITGMSDAEFTGRVSKAGAATAAESGTFVEVDATNMPGVYYYEFTQTECNTVGPLVLRVSGTESGSAQVMEVRELVCQVVPWDPYDSVRLGMTALPNANAEASGGLFTRGTGAGQINQVANGMIDANAVRHLGTAYATPSVAGVPEIDVTHWNGTAVASPVTAGVPNVTVTGIGTFSLGPAYWFGLTGYPASSSIGYAQCQGGTSTTVTLNASEVSTTDIIVGATVYLIAGPGEHQFRTITAYNGSTKVATVDRAWVTNPTSSSYYTLFVAPQKTITGSIDSATVADAVWDAATTDHNSSGSFGEYVQDIVASTLGGAPFAVWDALRSGHVVSGSFGEGVIVNSIANGAITAASIASDAITAAKIAADAVAEIADGVWDEVIENSKTARQWLRGIKSVLWGKLAITGTSRTYRDDADSKARVTATVGPTGRTTITEDLT